MSDRELSNPMIYEISIDWDDAADGSDGGYHRHGNFVIPSAMQEIVRLRSEIKAADELLKVKDQRDKMLKTLKVCVEAMKTGVVNINPHDECVVQLATKLIGECKGEQE